MTEQEKAGATLRMYRAWREHLKRIWTKGATGKLQTSFEVLTVPPFLFLVLLFSLWGKHLKALSGKSGNGKLLAGLEVIFPVVLLLVLVSLNVGNAPEVESVSAPVQAPVSTPAPTPKLPPVPSTPKSVDTPNPENISDAAFIKMAMEPENAAGERKDMLMYLKMLEDKKKDLDARYTYCRKHGYKASNPQEWGTWSHQWNSSLKTFEKGLEAVFYVDDTGVYQGKWKEAFASFKMACTDLYFLWSAYDSELDGRKGDVSHFKSQFEKRLKSARKALSQ